LAKPFSKIVDALAKTAPDLLIGGIGSTYIKELTVTLPI